MIADTALQRFSGPWVRRSQLRDDRLPIIGMVRRYDRHDLAARASVHHSRRQSHRSALQHVASRLVCARDSERATPAACKRLLPGAIHPSAFGCDVPAERAGRTWHLERRCAANRIQHDDPHRHRVLRRGDALAGNESGHPTIRLGAGRGSILAGPLPHSSTSPIWSCSGSLRRLSPSAPSIVCCTRRSGDMV